MSVALTKLPLSLPRITPGLIEKSCGGIFTGESVGQFTRCNGLSFFQKLCYAKIAARNAKYIFIQLIARYVPEVALKVDYDLLDQLYVEMQINLITDLISFLADISV